MRNTETRHRILVFDPPLPEELVYELIGFWQGLFQADYEPFRSILNGKERGQNRDVFYLVKRGGKTVGTCHLTMSESSPELGGMGEVGTAAEFRGMGIASVLCARARDDFRNAGGQALFLGTGNPAAARVYRRLGWRKLAGANVMVFVADEHSSEAFLVDYFGNGGAATVAVGSAIDRIPMIPLLISPHDWQVMDANAGMHSTRYVVQNSCMGLYPRYETLTSGGRGAWFAGRTNQGCLVGISTSHLDGAGGCQVDGFTHHNHRAALGSLLEAAVSWANTHGAAPCWSRVSIEDEDKISRFEGLGFRRARVDKPFDLGGRQVTSVRLERNT